MTRLSEALDRANQLNVDDRAHHDGPPPGWAFDSGDFASDAPQTEAVAAPEPHVETPLLQLPRALETRFPEDDRRKVVVGSQADPAVVEQYRRLAAALHHAQLERRARSVMIASAAPAEGKTLTSTNLALTLSQSYQRPVLLVDA